MKKILLLLSLVLIFSGCSYVGTSKNTIVNPQNTKVAIELSDSFYLVYPKNGLHYTLTIDRKENLTSAQEAVKTFTKRFNKKMSMLEVSPIAASLNEGFENAANKGIRYLVDMNIKIWNNELYFLCSRSLYAGKTDSVIITIDVYDVATKNKLNSQELSNSGCPTVLLSLIPIGTMGAKGRFKNILTDWENNLKPIE